MQTGVRGENAVDFWRGLALVMIFIDHIPGNVVSYLTLRNFAISDAAELFVFLAGWSTSFATGGPLKSNPPGQVTFRLLYRAVQIYRAQLVISVIAIALLSASALWSENPLFLEWHNASVVFYDPARASIGLVLLTYQLSYFNILPLYVVILLAAPVFVLIGRRSLTAAMGLSLAIYLFAIVTRTNPTGWPAADTWYLNPLSWQLLFVAGFAAAEISQRSSAAVALAARLWPIAAALVILGLIVTRLEWWPDPFKVPEPRHLFLFDKTYLSPARLLSMMALVLAFQGAFGWLNAIASPVSRWLCALGRNSLAVFSVASLASLLGQICRFLTHGGIAIDIAMISLGVCLMGFTAWFVEWRSRLQPPAR